MIEDTLTREWLIPLGISALIPIATIVIAYAKHRAVRGLSAPVPPKVVQYLQSQIDADSATIDLEGFVKVGRINGRLLYRQRVSSPTGNWTISVECSLDGAFIAFEAVFQSSESALLFTKVRGNRKRTRLLCDMVP